jgi:hypothetical protein
VVPFLGILALIVFWMVYSLIRRRREGLQSELIKKSKLLHNYYLHMKEDLSNICLGTEYCRTCQGSRCNIGQSKEIVQAALNNQEPDEAAKKIVTKETVPKDKVTKETVTKDKVPEDKATKETVTKDKVPKDKVTKEIVTKEIAPKEKMTTETEPKEKVLPENDTNIRNKPFSEEEVIDCLVDTLWLISSIKDDKSLTNAHLIRNQMEVILLGRQIKEFEDVNSYIAEVRQMDAELSDKIDSAFRMRKQKYAYPLKHA